MPTPKKKKGEKKIVVPKSITRRASARVKAVVKDSSKVTPEVADLAESLDKAHALDVMAQTEGARVLIDSLVSDVISIINALSNRYRTIPEMEMRSMCAEMGANLGIILSISRAKGNKEALDEALSEALKT